MELTLIRHLWGVESDWEAAFPTFQQAGYTGIENGLPAAADADRFRALLREFGFAYIPMIFTQGRTVDENVASFTQQVEACAAFKPLFITAHSGRDAWSDEESIQFFEQALTVEEQAGIAVAHETHRGRVLYNPWVTSRLLRQFPTLKLCCDLSHWVCVCERLLETETDIIQQAAQQCLHIHARVGYEEGPQVSDPRAAEYRTHLETHEQWWRMMWQAQQSQGMAVTTLTPEFGPPPYLHTLPVTQTPVSDLSAICDWMAAREAAQFEQWRSAGL